MTASAHDRVKELFLKVCDLDERQRAAVLDRDCAGDAQLRREVESLLAHHHDGTLLAVADRPAKAESSASQAAGPLRGLLRLWLLAIGPDRWRLAAAAGALLLLVAGGIWAQRGIEQALRTRLREGLQAVLAADVTALEVWLHERRRQAERWADQPELREQVVALALLSRAAESAPVAGQALRDAPQQARLRQILAWYGAEPGNVGYVVLDRAGLVIAASDDTNVGRQLDPDGMAEHARVLGGQSRVLKPSPDGAFLEDRPTDRENPMIWVGAPVVDASGAVAATLAFGVRADQQFTRILSAARMGRSGETYAFDEDGTFLSESRFTDQLKTLGLVPDQPRARATFQVQVRDPGVNLARGERPRDPVAARPLTAMAARAVAGEAGVDVDGYRDYRGVPVVGAWQWLPEYGFGVATEVDYDEAFAPLRYPLVVSWLPVAIGVLAAGGLAYSMYRIASLRRQIGASRQIGSYTLLEKIGEGGMGVVYRARHALLQRPTAVKLLKPDQESETAVARFEREVQLASQLSHPHTIEIYDYGRTPDGLFYYAMEYLSGLSLAELVRACGPLPPARVAYIARQICGSLAEAHAIGLVHRDIKPQNILLCQRGGLADFVKVLDFGLVKRVQAKPADTLTAVGSLPGTPRYLAPELLRDPQSASPRSDIYALGAVLYNLLSGEKVFGDVGDLELLHQVLEVVPAPPSQWNAAVPAALDQLVLACLAKDPAGRPPSASDVEQRLDAIEGLGVWTQRDAQQWWQTRRAADRQTVAHPA